MMESINPNILFLFVDISEKVFKEQAYLQELKVKFLKENIQKPFMNNDDFIKEIEPFYSKFYQIIILKMINNVLDVNLLIHQNIINGIYSCHRSNSIAKLEKIWKSQRFCLPTPFNFFFKMIFQGVTIIYNEIDSIYSYFGEKVTIHYAFVSFLCCHLFILSIAGLIYSLFKVDELFNGYELFPIWGYICCFWSMLILKLWIRKNREIVYRWGVNDISTVREVRDDYKGDELSIGKTLKLEKFSNSNKNVS